MPEDIALGLNTEYNTKIPSITDTADIQAAFRLYHYGLESDAGKSMVYHLTDLQDQIDDAVASIPPNLLGLWPAKGSLVSSTASQTLATIPLSATAGQVLTVSASAETGIAWQNPEVTLINSVTLSNKTLINTSISNSGISFLAPTGNTFSTVLGITTPTANRSITLPDASTELVGTNTTQTLTNKTIDLEAASNTITGRLASTNGGIPAGVISQFAGSTAPDGYLLCQGQSVSTITYASLFAAIGYNYGGSGSSFNLPNLQNRVPVGRGSGTFANLNATGGAETATLTAAQMPSHNHSGTTGTVSSGHTHNFSTGGISANHTHSGPSHNHSVTALLSRYFVGRASGTITTYMPNDASATGSSFGGTGQTGTVSSDHSHSGTTGDINQNHNHSFTTSSAGNDQAHNNLQPYIVVNYIIKT